MRKTLATMVLALWGVAVSAGCVNQATPPPSPTAIHTPAVAVPTRTPATTALPNIYQTNLRLKGDCPISTEESSGRVRTLDAVINSFQTANLESASPNNNVNAAEAYDLLENTVAVVSNAEQAAAKGIKIGKGYIVTAAHMVMYNQNSPIGAPRQFEVSDWATGTYYETKDIDAVWVNPYADVALLRFKDVRDTRGEQEVRVRLKTAESLKVGDDVYVVRWVFQNGKREISLGNGKLTGLDKENYYGVPIALSTTPFLKPGDSGAPIINKAGQIVGIVSSGSLKTGYSTPIDYVVALLGSERQHLTSCRTQ